MANSQSAPEPGRSVSSRIIGATCATSAFEGRHAAQRARSFLQLLFRERETFFEEIGHADPLGHREALELLFEFGADLEVERLFFALRRAALAGPLGPPAGHRRLPSISEERRVG